MDRGEVYEEWNFRENERIAMSERSRHQQDEPREKNFGNRNSSASKRRDDDGLKTYNNISGEDWTVGISRTSLRALPVRFLLPEGDSLTTTF